MKKTELIEKISEIKAECARMTKVRALGGVPNRVYLSALDLHAACAKMTAALNALEKDGE